VRRLFAGFAVHGDAEINPHYDHCGVHQTRRTAQKILDTAMQIRIEHPPWGAPLIHVLMQQAQKRADLPTPRTLQRWFKKRAAPPAPPGRRPALNPERAQQPHEVWQMDAVEHVPLADQQQISWLRIVDELSGAVLQTNVFPQGAFGTVGATTVQEHVRDAFFRWGRPGAFRVDNGAPWGSSMNEFPTDLALWLFGLDVEVLWNPPRQPQKNGVVERFQGVGKRWGEPATCHSPKELQQRLNRLDRIQREVYPYRNGRSRMAVWTGLKHSGRQYDRTWETKRWDLDRVLRQLSHYLATRHVDCCGMISIYNRNYYVGERYQGIYVTVTLDPLARTWVIQDQAGCELRTHPAEQLTQERILGLKVYHRRPKPK
jgi:transposase InsO family protein